MTRPPVDGRLVALLEYEFERTEAYHARARAGVGLLRSGRLAVMSALEFYHAILPGIRHNHYDIFGRRAGTGRCISPAGLPGMAARQLIERGAAPVHGGFTTAGR